MQSAAQAALPASHEPVFHMKQDRRGARGHDEHHGIESVGVARRPQQARKPEQPMATADTPSPGLHAQGILAARPTGSPARMPAAGTRPLAAGEERDGLLRIPRVIAADRPAPLLVMLHGAGGSAANVMPIVADSAEAHGVTVLAPESRDVTWDV